MCEVGLWLKQSSLNHKRALYSMRQKKICRWKIGRETDGAIVKLLRLNRAANAAPVGIKQKYRRRIEWQIQLREMFRAAS